MLERLFSFRCSPTKALAGRAVAHIINGRAVNTIARLQQPDPANPGEFIPLTRGKIALEIEYAEI